MTKPELRQALREIRARVRTLSNDPAAEEVDHEFSCIFDAIDLTTDTLHTQIEESNDGSQS